MGLLSWAIQILGTLSLIYFGSILLFKLIQTFRSILPRDLSARYGKGSWVVVTGASDGIGKGFCEEFAKDGFNIVFVSRNPEKLSKVVEEFKKKYPHPQTKVIVADFAKSSDKGFFENIMDQLKGLDVSVLVNNVGTGIAYAFKDYPEDQLQEVINLNILPQTILTRKLINHFANRSQKSAVINVASTLCMKPFPFVAPYSASKIYCDYLSRALAAENPNMDILCLRPCFVDTPLAAWMPKNFWFISPNECARGAMNKLGLRKFTHGHWKHSVYVTATLAIIPDWLFDIMSRNVGLQIIDAHEKMGVYDKFKKKTQ